MKRFKGMVPYLLLCLVAFYALPLVSKDTAYLAVSLLLMTPLVCFVVAMVYGAAISFDFIFCIFIGLLFIPAMFIFYNTTIWIYIILYFGVSFIANIIGQVIATTCKRVNKVMVKEEI